MTEEVWRDIPGYEGAYQVSSYGRVRGLTRVVESRWGTPKPWRGKILKQGTIHHGYKNVVLSSDGKTKTYRVHRLVMNAFVGPCPEGMEVMHLDNNTSNNRLDNLTYGTPSQNQVHRTLSGNRPRKLSDDDVRDIRNSISKGVTCKAIAEQYDLSISSVRQIKTGRAYAWLT